MPSPIFCERCGARIHWAERTWLDDTDGEGCTDDAGREGVHSPDDWDQKRHQTDEEIDACVEEVKAEIREDIGVAQGSAWEPMPEDISSFSELHDYVDANEYGGFTDSERRAHWSLGDMVAVQEKVDAWLKAGRPERTGTT